MKKHMELNFQIIFYQYKSKTNQIINFQNKIKCNSFTNIK